MNTSIVKESSPELGAVLFIDLDGYMCHASGLSAADEQLLSKELVSVVVAAASAFEIRPIRTFGDGFLLALDGPPDAQVLARALGFIALMRDKVAERGFTIKAGLAAGPFVLEPDLPASSGFRLVGPAGNRAGKLVGSASKGELVVAWPSALGELTKSISFDGLVATVPARKVKIEDIDPTTPNLDVFGTAPRLEERGQPSSSLPSKNESIDLALEFGSQVKVYTGEMVKLADDKAKFSLSVAAGLLAYLFNQRVPSIIGGQFRTSPIELLGSVMLIAALLLFIAAFCLGALVLIPRMAAAYRGFVFFGSVAKWGDGDSYWRELLALSPQQVARETVIHNYEYAKVAAAKYWHLRLSMLTLFWGLAAVLVYFLVWDGLMKT